MHTDLEKEIRESSIPVFVDYWGSWCPPCKMMEPVIESLSHDLKGKVKVVKINIDHNPRIRAQFNVIGVPTFIVFNKGAEQNRSVGAHSKKQLLDLLKRSGIEI